MKPEIQEQLSIGSEQAYWDRFSDRSKRVPATEVSATVRALVPPAAGLPAERSLLGMLPVLS